jgi:hypothetical protein
MGIEVRGGSDVEGCEFCDEFLCVGSLGRGNNGVDWVFIPIIIKY